MECRKRLNMDNRIVYLLRKWFVEFSIVPTDRIISTWSGK